MNQLPPSAILLALLATQANQCPLSAPDFNASGLKVTLGAGGGNASAQPTFTRCPGQLSPAIHRVFDGGALIEGNLRINIGGTFRDPNTGKIKPPEGEPPHVYVWSGGVFFNTLFMFNNSLSYERYGNFAFDGTPWRSWNLEALWLGWGFRLDGTPVKVLNDGEYVQLSIPWTQMQGEPVQQPYRLIAGNANGCFIEWDFFGLVCPSSDPLECIAPDPNHNFM